MAREENLIKCQNVLKSSRRVIMVHLGLHSSRLNKSNYFENDETITANKLAFTKKETGIQLRVEFSPLNENTKRWSGE